AAIEGVAEQHRRRQDGGDGVRHPLARDVRRGTVHRLVEPPRPARAREGSMPMEPARMAASSERMSPKVFSVTMVSKCVGLCTSAMAQLSTRTCSTADRK